MEQKKVLLSIKDLVVKFRVRGRILTAIRNINLDIYENESIAIVGESGSGKSVFTKTFAGMLDSNGFIDQGSIIYDDSELADTTVSYNKRTRRGIAFIEKKLNEASKLEAGAETWQEIQALEAEKKARATLSEEEMQAMEDEIKEIAFQRTELFNLKQTYDPRKEKELIRKADKRLKEMDQQIENLKKTQKERIAKKKQDAATDQAFLVQVQEKKDELNARYKQEIAGGITRETEERNAILAKEIELSVGRYGALKRRRNERELVKALTEAMREGKNLDDEEVRNAVFDPVTFRVRYLDETENRLHGTCVLNLAKVKDATDWTKIRGTRIATVFQDPMTSLNPIITIGKQIMSIIIKHQKCSEVEARRRALELMYKVGIPNPEKRFDDYPFQYSGGMRQRIVIAIALSCQPKVLICDEPTTALDVTIQAQILKLLKDLQKEFNYTIVFITHDLGVVANIADRVAVMYAGQIVEYGEVEEVFYDPRHPYTWALLSSLPQLAERNTELFSITGTPPSLYNKIVGDPFAPRNNYCMKIDTLKEPPMFQVSETHYAKTWLLDPRAPKVEKPKIIENIHEKLVEAYHL
ncbi:oligopeptide transport system ATP-binding protein [Aristaeella hokkaidonensis]|uniref:ATP-binding cassette domain-containing protein n=1 Tax=Aristaeella hokkaidonensis TaxID=3046382 RepID=A0AC61MW88_9FIRM|nr:ATP-binding cassette domain-containing protein [Aristaeella hokkaidonensis]SNT94379.1 oligopeptide transport system ATP-binding protein [Aristaeella hokkaidonensis]